MSFQNIVIDVSDIKFCIGPCSSKECEPNVITLENGKKQYYFKPYNGGKYKELCFPIGKESYLILNNARICSCCNNRYLENWDESDYETLEADANIIRQKLDI